MSKASRTKGNGYEREIVNWFTARGVEAERVPLSGAAKGSYAADLRFGPALGWTGEAKRFASGLAKMYQALEQDGADVVFARGDRKPTLVCMTLETFEAFLDELAWTTEGARKLYDHWGDDVHPVELEMRGKIE
jgi:hypothetical protein